MHIVLCYDLLQAVFGLERLVDSTIAKQVPAIAYGTTIAIRFVNNVIGEWSAGLGRVLRCAHPGGGVASVGLWRLGRYGVYGVMASVSGEFDVVWSYMSPTHHAQLQCHMRSMACSATADSMRGTSCGSADGGWGRILPACFELPLGLS